MKNVSCVKIVNILVLTNQCARLLITQNTDLVEILTPQYVFKVAP